MLPEVWAIGIMPSSASLAATISAARALSTMVMPDSRIQIDNHTIGQRLARPRFQFREADDAVDRSSAAHGPLRNVHLERSEIGQPDDRRLVVGDDVVDDSVAGADVHPAYPVGRTHRRVLLIEGELFWPNPVRKPQPGHRPVANMREHHRSDS